MNRNELAVLIITNAMLISLSSVALFIALPFLTHVGLPLLGYIVIAGSIVMIGFAIFITHHMLTRPPHEPREM